MNTAFPPLFESDLEHVLVHTKPLWDEMKNARLFITGGTGFFGVWLLESFCHANEVLQLNASATILTRNIAAFASKVPQLATFPNLTFLQGDIRNFAFPDGKFSHVIHAATETGLKLNGEGSWEMLDSIIAGTKRVLAFTERAGVKKFLLTSSGAIYGQQPPGLEAVPENYHGGPNPLDSKAAYGEGKRVSEHMVVVHAFKHGYEAKIARCFAFVGPGLPLGGHYAIGNFIRDALSHKKIDIYGDGSPIRSYLYASDLAIWLWTILMNGRSGSAYNVGSPEGITIARLAREVNRVLGNDAGISISNRDGVDSFRSRYVPDVSRARDELGLIAKISLGDSVRRTAQWYKLFI